jgi:hypothetical protein
MKNEKWNSLCFSIAWGLSLVEEVEGVEGVEEVEEV